MSDDEEILQEEIGETNIKSLLQAQIKMNASELFKQNELEKRKNKSAPREFSAKVKPKKWKNPINLEIKNTLRRDPRFEDYTGEFKASSFEKNYGFVEKETKEYIDHINKLKKNKKFQIDPEKFGFLKKQENFVKGWMKKKEYDKLKENVENDMKQENKEREKAGRNKIFLKKKVLKEVISKKVLEKKGENKKELKKYLKKKNHMKANKNKKEENFSKSLV